MSVQIYTHSTVTTGSSRPNDWQWERTVHSKLLRWHQLKTCVFILETRLLTTCWQCYMTVPVWLWLNKCFSAVHTQFRYCLGIIKTFWLLVYNWRGFVSLCDRFCSVPFSVGASSGAHHCHPDHAYGGESDKVSHAPLSLGNFTLVWLRSCCPLAPR